MRRGPGRLHPELVRSLTRFVGRATETTALVELLRTRRMVTVVGAPGIGKTRLTAEALPEVADVFGDGVRTIGLAGVGAEDVTAAVAAALGVREGRTGSLTERIVDTVRDSELLLVLDNCEHAVDRLADLAGQVVTAAPGVTVLATSRVPLGLAGERLQPLSSLSGPEAVDLFTDRAGQVIDLVLDAEALASVEAICQRLDGIPMAIELAARQARSLSLPELIDRLDGELLRMRLPGPAPIHDSMSAAVASSCRLLSPEQDRLLTVLAVFAGDFSLAAVEAVSDVGTSLPADLSTLVEHSLVQAQPGPAGQLHYRLLEPIRQFAAARLAESSDADAVRARHAAHFLAVGQHAARALFGVGGHRWYEELRRAEGNVLAAANSAQTQDSSLALRLVTCLAGYWDHRGHLDQARVRIEELLDRCAGPSRTRAEALHALSHFAYRQGRFRHGVPLAEECLAIMEELGDPDGTARALRVLAMVASCAGDPDRALVTAERSVAIFEDLGDVAAQAWSLTTLGLVHFCLGDVDGGAQVGEAALELIGHEDPTPLVSRRIHIALSFAAARHGDPAAHRTHLAAAIDDLRMIDGLEGDGDWLGSATFLAHSEGRDRSALRLAGGSRSETRRDRGMPPVADEACRSAIAAAESALGPRRATEQYEIGAAMTTDELATEALAPPSVDDAVLTTRERQVTELTGEGLGNAAIAERLYISRRTVESHQDNIRAKLGLASRYEVMKWALARQSV